MLSLIKRWIASFKYPADPLFKRRPQAAKGFGAWVLVELGATEYVMLMDTLRSIHVSNGSIEDKGRQIMGLRYQALAMSLRTKRGRIPLDWRLDADLMWLARLPYSEVVPALQQISELSDIPWLNPVQEPKDDDQSEPVFVAEELSANP